MNYIDRMLELSAGDNPRYPRNDIGTAQLFFDLHSDFLRFVKESDCWFVYDGRRWEKDHGGYAAMELCKSFVQAFSEFVANCHADDKVFVQYAAKLSNHYRRKGILADAQSIAPLRMVNFASPANHPYQRIALFA